MSSDLQPRIYVACLASYNNGVLHGAWIDATQDADSIREEIAAVLRDSKFPNVTVECPACEGHGGLAAGVGQVMECPECKGSGRVPSAEEYAIHDYEDFGGLKLGEHEDIDTIAHAAEMLEEHGEAWALWADNIGDTSLTSDDFQSAYQGYHTSREAWAEDYAEQTGLLSSVPEDLRMYIDMDAYGRDMEMNGDFAFLRGSGGTLHVFSNHG